jgi:superoxide reductase
MGIANKIQSADWKAEKHAPVIECADTIQAGEKVKIKVSVGKEIPHPNTIEHHISWIQVFFNPEGEKFAYDLGRFEFNAHGEAESLTEPAAAIIVKLSKPGTLHAVSHCNIHGLWESEKEIKVS